MTEQQIDRDRLRALDENATPGPWTVEHGSDWGLDGRQVPQSSVSRADRVAITWDDHGGEVFVPADAEFIAASRQAVPALLDMLDQAEAERDQARSQVDRVRELHQPCNHDAPCRGDCAECGQHMPCDTIRALDGDQ